MDFPRFLVKCQDCRRGCRLSQVCQHCRPKTIVFCHEHEKNHLKNVAKKHLDSVTQLIKDFHSHIDVVDNMEFCHIRAKERVLVWKLLNESIKKARKFTPSASVDLNLNRKEREELQEYAAAIVKAKLVTEDKSYARCYCCKSKFCEKVILPRLFSLKTKLESLDKFSQFESAKLENELGRYKKLDEELKKAEKDLSSTDIGSPKKNLNKQIKKSELPAGDKVEADEPVQPTENEETTEKTTADTAEDEARRESLLNEVALSDYGSDKFESDDGQKSFSLSINSRYRKFAEDYDEYWDSFKSDQYKEKTINYPPIGTKVKWPELGEVVGLFAPKRLQVVAVFQDGVVLIYNPENCRFERLVKLILPKQDNKRKKTTVACCSFGAVDKKFYFSTESNIFGILTCPLDKIVSSSSDESANKPNIVELDHFVRQNRLCPRRFGGMAVDPDNGVLYSCDPVINCDIGAWSLENKMARLECFIKKPVSLEHFQPVACAVSRTVEKADARKRRLLAVADSYGYGSIHLFAIGEKCSYYIWKITNTDLSNNSHSFPSSLYFDAFSNLLILRPGNRRLQILPKLQDFKPPNLSAEVWESDELASSPLQLTVVEPLQPDSNDDAADEDEEPPRHFRDSMCPVLWLSGNKIIHLKGCKK